MGDWEVFKPGVKSNLLRENLSLCLIQNSFWSLAPRVMWAGGSSRACSPPVTGCGAWCVTRRGCREGLGWIRWSWPLATCCSRKLSPQPCARYRLCITSSIAWAAAATSQNRICGRPGTAPPPHVRAAWNGSFIWADWAIPAPLSPLTCGRDRRLARPCARRACR